MRYIDVPRSTSPLLRPPMSTSRGLWVSYMVRRNSRKRCGGDLVVIDRTRGLGRVETLGKHASPTRALLKIDYARSADLCSIGHTRIASALPKWLSADTTRVCLLTVLSITARETATNRLFREVSKAVRAESERVRHMHPTALTSLGKERRAYRNFESVINLTLRV